MGWSSGTRLLGGIIVGAELVLAHHVPDETMQDFYYELIELFKGADCDTIEELLEDESTPQNFIEAYRDYMDDDDEKNWK